jgi:nitrite reductase (NO-forming)
MLALLSVSAFAQEDIKVTAERGKAVYMATCMVCHQLNGAGLPGAFPPLGKVEYANGDARRAVAIVLKGINAPLTVNGMTYVVPMPQPDIAYPMLKEDKNVADVLNYVRTSFGNEVKEAITPAFVAEVRKEFAERATPWTEAELKNFPAKK